MRLRECPETTVRRVEDWREMAASVEASNLEQ
jgi:hypothetical protein